MKKEIIVAVMEKLIGSFAMTVLSVVGFSFLMEGAQATSTATAVMPNMQDLTQGIIVGADDVSRALYTWGAYLLFSGIGGLFWVRVSGVKALKGFGAIIPSILVSAALSGVAVDYVGSRYFQNYEDLPVIAAICVMLSLVVCAVTEWMSEGENRGKFVRWIIERITGEKKED